MSLQEEIQGASQEQIENSKTTFNQWGKEFAQSTNKNPESLKNGLDTVYSDFLKKQKLDKDGIAERIKKLQADISELLKFSEDTKAKNKQLEIENQKAQERYDQMKNEVLDCDNRILEIQKKEIPEGDKTKLNLYLIFGLAVLLAVFLAYASTFGSALLGLEETDTFIRASVFTDLMDAGTGVLVFALFISIIPLVCGYFFANYYQNGRKSLAFAILAVVILVDIFVGYKLTETIYNQQYMLGIHDEEWRPVMAFTDPNFYIVLVVNFGLYFAFSMLTNAYFAESEKLSPDHIIEKEIAQVNNEKNLIKERMAELKDKIEENLKLIEANLAYITNCSNDIKSKEKDIADYKDGVLPINIDYLKELIGMFMEGYQAYVNVMTQREEDKKNIITEVMAKQNEWLEEKEKNGWRSNQTELPFHTNFNIN